MQVQELAKKYGVPYRIVAKNLVCFPCYFDLEPSWIYFERGLFQHNASLAGVQRAAEAVTRE